MTTLHKRNVLPFVRPISAPRLLGWSLLGWSLLLLAGACSGGSGQGAAKGPDGKRCTEVLDRSAPDFPALTEATPRSSKLWLDITLPLSELEGRIAKEIPKVIAQEKDRDVGAPGRATFKVTRKSPQISETEDELLVSVPLDLSISVCKPIGGGCLKYGSCEPQLLTTFAFSKAPGKDYELPPPKASVSATKRCVIGMDVTSHIVSAAEKELKGVEAEIAQKWPDLKPEVKRAYRELRAPLKVAESACYYFAPEKVLFVQPRLSQKADPKAKNDSGRQLLAGFGLVGEIRSAPDCTTEQELGKLPPLTTTEKTTVPGSALWLPETLTEEALRAQLSASLENLSAGKMSDLKIGQDKFALRLEGAPGFCDPVWVTGQFQGTADGLGVGQVEVFGTPPSDSTTALQTLVSKVTFPLVLSETSLEASRERLEQDLKAQIQKEARFELVPLRSEKVSVNATVAGLLIERKVSTRLRVTGLGDPEQTQP